MSDEEITPSTLEFAPTYFVMGQEEEDEDEDDSNEYLSTYILDMGTCRNKQRELLNDNNLQAKLVNEFKEHDSWLLFKEAIPLAMGIHPAHSKKIKIDEFTMYKIVSRLARSAIGVNSLIINPTFNESEWRVIPAEFSKWLASKNINAITPILALAEGNIQKKKKINDSPLEPNPRKERHAVVREKIYIAAIALITTYPEQCKGSNGDWSPTAIAKMIEEKAPFWFGNEEAPLTTRRKSELIAAAIKSMESID